MTMVENLGDEGSRSEGPPPFPEASPPSASGPPEAVLPGSGPTPDPDTWLKTILHHSSNVFFAHTPDNLLVYVSPQIKEVLGYAPEDARVPWTELLTQHPANQEGVRRTQEAVRTGRPPPPYELELRHKDGRSVWVEVREAPVVSRGETVAVVGAWVDITERKQAEAALRASQEQLQLQQRIEALGRLSGGVAHDLNNLLSPILGYAELLLEDLGPGDQRREAAEQILEAAQRARDLVRQLLAFSRRQTLEFRPLDLGQVVREFGKLLRRTIPENVQIEMDLAPDLPTILADVGQLEQVILNLAVNARDAMPEGGSLIFRTRLVHITPEEAQATPGMRPGAFVLLSVSDTGHGMDPATRQRIFEPFFTTKELGKGTGLGLATVYGIIKQHGGGIWVDSEVGMGTTFRCYFPVVGGQLAPLHPPSPSTTPPPTLGGTETVMVVEDEPLVRRLAVRFLRRLGYHTLEAASGEECLALLDGYSGPLHLLLTDLVLPGMNGRALAAEVQNRFRQVRTLFMSGYASHVLNRQGVLEEGIAYLAKPFAFHTLAAKVREVLDRP